MTGPKYYYYLIDNNGHYYYTDNATGEVKTTPTKKALRYSARNWATQAIKWGRQTRYFGIVQTISGALEFTGDGQTILQHIYNKDSAANYNAYCRLLIEERIDGPEDTWNYETWYSGLVDFVQYTDGEDEHGIFCKITCHENGAAQLLEANSSKEYEIPLIGGMGKTVEMKGVKLHGLHTWQAADLDTAQMQGSIEAFVYPMGLVGEDSTNYLRNTIYLQEQGYEIANIGTTTPNDANRFLHTKIDFTGKTTIDFNFNWNSTATPARLRLVLLRKQWANNTSAIVHTFWDSGSVAGTGGNVTNTATVSHNYLAYNYNYFICFIGDFSSQAYNIDIVNMTLTLEYDEALPYTDTAALRYYDYGAALISKATDGQLTLQSQYLKLQSGDLHYFLYDQIPYHEFITSGDALRQLPDPVIKGSFDQYMQDCFVRHMCGYAIVGDKLIIERLEYFLNKDVKAATVRAQKLNQRRPAQDYLYNKIVVGYPSFKANDLNGRFEVNSRQEYEIGYQNITEEMDLTTPYKASVYEIEYLRSTIFDEQTRDKDNDNSIYLLYTASTTIGGKFQLNKHASGVTGVPNPATHYNVEFSPQRFIWRFIPFFKSIMNIRNGYVGSDYKISFISGDRNTEFQTQFNNTLPGELIYEGGPVYLGEVPASKSQSKLFIPTLIDIEALPDSEVLQQIRQNQNGYLEIIHDNGVFNAFLMDGEFNGADAAAYKFTVMLAPEQDTMQFVKR